MQFVYRRPPLPPLAPQVILLSPPPYKHNLVSDFTGRFIFLTSHFTLVIPSQPSSSPVNSESPPPMFTTPFFLSNQHKQSNAGQTSLILSWSSCEAPHLATITTQSESSCLISDLIQFPISTHSDPYFTPINCDHLPGRTSPVGASGEANLRNPCNLCNRLSFFL